jgi:hypothetical protein
MCLEKNPPVVIKLCLTIGVGFFKKRGFFGERFFLKEDFLGGKIVN